MTREELIQSPEYWSTQYENECWRLGIKPNKVTFKSTEINEKKLDELAIEKACEFADTYQEKTGNYGHNEDTLAVGYRCGYYDGYRRAMEE